MKLLENCQRKRNEIVKGDSMNLKEYLVEHPTCVLKANNVKMVFKGGKLVTFGGGEFMECEDGKK